MNTTNPNPQITQFKNQTKGKTMKRNVSVIIIGLLMVFVFTSGSVLSQDVTVVAPTSEAAEGLDLQAVGELFKDAKDLEAFEKALNDPDVGVNNLDLDDNGEVDYIRVVEDVSDDTHVIILQVPLGENEFQDVATIEVEKTGSEEYNMQVHGDEVIYGVNYYVAPVQVRIHTWPIITWIYRPLYRPYRSAFYFGFHPVWWHPWRPVAVHVYHTRTVKVTASATFSVTKTSRVTSVTKVNYKPSSSTLVKKQTKVTRTGGETTRTTRVTKKTTGAGGKTTVTAGKKKVTDPGTGKTTTVRGAQKTTKTSEGKTTTRVGKKTTRH
jgi:hypothetical protein